MPGKIMFFISLMIAFNAFTSIDLKAATANDTIAGKTDTVSANVNAEKPLALTPYHRNVIKFNPTPMLLWGEIRNITLSYERLIRKNQSISIQLGYLVIPKFFDTVLNLIRVNEYARRGVNIALDYRYYPQFRNRRPAPDGLYIGGYLSYYGFRFNNSIDILATTSSGDGTLRGTLNMLNLGLELGYQFIFWKRFSVDLLMFGPSLSLYYRKLELTGDLDKSEFEQIDEELARQLIDRFPVLGYLFGGQTATFSGGNANISTGFRYSIQLGFHF